MDENAYHFHHTGLASRSLEQDIEWFAILGYMKEGPAFTDPLQGVKGQFMVLGDARIELLESLPDSHVLDNLLRRRSPIYHIGFEVSNIQRSLEALSSSGAKVVSDPKPAIAFAGRRVAFCMRQNGTVIELIESDRGYTGTAS
jgi:methylmalonyl-CoA/ethylmalonyl-CoA epimerase